LAKFQRARQPAAVTQDGSRQLELAGVGFDI
jgi:hypothetical protein